LNLGQVILERRLAFIDPNFIVAGENLELLNLPIRNCQVAICILQFAMCGASTGVLPFMVGATGVASEPSSAERASLLLVRGAAGTDEFGKLFDAWEAQWRAAAEKGDVAVRTIGSDRDSEAPPLDALRQAISTEADGSARPLWIVLIGHGTFDGRDAKFNLSGPDVTAGQLAEWLEPVGRPLAVINCASSSAPFLDRLCVPGRVVITATRSGHEVNFARFGGHLARAIDDATADLDKDGQVSLLEAFLTASRWTSAAYQGLGQLATEHALLDDTGDSQGVSEDFFDGLLPVKQPEGNQTLDGHRAHQWHFVPSEEERRFPDELRPRRDELELEIARLRDQKPQLNEDEYYAQLERLLVDLAELYERAESTGQESGDRSQGSGDRGQGDRSLKPEIRDSRSEI
jgi:hypothetical protein